METPKKKGRKKAEPAKAKQTLIDLQRQTGLRLVNKKNARSLDELTNEQYSPYQQKTLAEYEAYLDDLNLTDLQEHAANLAIALKDDRRALINTLIKEYKLKSSSHYNTIEHQNIAFNTVVNAETLKILSEGR